MQIDWQKSEWQCVRMVIDQLVNEIVELAKQLQDARRNYSDALSKITEKDDLISPLRGAIAARNRKISINLAYIEELRDMLIDRGMTEEQLDDMFERMCNEYDGIEDNDEGSIHHQ